MAKSRLYFFVLCPEKRRMSCSQLQGFLDACTLRELIQLHCDGARSSSLISEFFVDRVTGRLFRKFPCEVKKNPLAAKTLKRKRQRGHSGIADLYSEKCDHDLEIEPAQLDAGAAVALISLIRCGGWIGEATIGSLQDSEIPFSPKEILFRHLLITVLLEKRLIVPSFNSPKHAFRLPPNKNPGWDPEAVYWSVLLPDPPSFIQQLEHIVASSDWPNGWRDDCSRFWRQLAVAECWEFCAYSIAQRSLPMPGAAALTTLFNNLLRDFSVSQCYQLIWASASDATDFWVRKQAIAQHAANYFVGGCQRKADRYRAEGWAIKGFKRNFKLPRSQLSYVLHDVFLKHGEAGFSSPVSDLNTIS